MRSLSKVSRIGHDGIVLYHTNYNPHFKQITTLWHAMAFIIARTQFIPHEACATCTTTGCTRRDVWRAAIAGLMRRRSPQLVGRTHTASQRPSVRA
jgi:hypothetical protein